MRLRLIPAKIATSVGIAQVCRVIIVGKILLMLLRWLHILYCLASLKLHKEETNLKTTPEYLKIFSFFFYRRIRMLRNIQDKRPWKALPFPKKLK